MAVQKPEPQREVRIALIDGLDKYHGQAFCSLFNKPAPRNPEDPLPPMPGKARVVALWDDDPAHAEELGRRFEIEHVCHRIEDALEKADAAILVDNVEMTHQRWLKPVLERGLPVFIDKPIAPTYKEAAEIVELAEKYNALMFSSSALRFAKELEQWKRSLQEGERPELAVACGPNGRFLFYGIHPFEAVYSVIGPGVKSVHRTGVPGRHAVRVEWESGQTGVFVVDERVRGFSFSFYTSRAQYPVTITDSQYFYHNLMVAFVEMVVTGKIPVPWSHTLEIMKVLEAVEKAAAQGVDSVIKFAPGA